MALTAEQLQAEFDDQGLSRVQVSLGQKEDAVELLMLDAKKKKAGLEGFALSVLTELADESGTELLVEIPGRAGRPRFQELAEFYARHDFVMSEGDVMRRLPAAQKN